MNNKKQATSYKQHNKHQAATNNQPVPPQQCSTGNKAGQCQLDDSSAKQMQLLQRFMDNQRVTEWLEASNNSKKGSNKCGDKVNAQQHRQKEDRGWDSNGSNAAQMGNGSCYCMGSHDGNGNGKVGINREPKVAEWLQSTSFFVVQCQGCQQQLCCWPTQ